MSQIESIQIGRVITEGDPSARDATSRQWTTGFYKSAVAGPVRAAKLGLQGDSVADTIHHGGPDKAILCYAAAHYPRWASEHPELNLSGGAFGENLTLTVADESNTCIGDRFEVGTCEFEVSQPRQPCWKITRRWGIKTLTKEVAQSGRTGWYVRVLREGVIESGQRLVNVARPHPNWTVARANDVLFGREVDRLAVIELMNLEQLAPAWKESIA